MISTVIAIVLYVAYLFALLALCTWVQTKVKRWVYCLIWTALCAAGALIDLFSHDQVGTALNVLVASFWFHEFWKNKPPFDRKKVAKLVGAKAKAIKDKVVAAMPKASPVSKPVFAPAGA